MPTSIVADLLDLMPDSVTAQPGSLDGFGGWIASGAALALTCIIEGQTRLIRDPSTGQEITSSVQVIVGEVNDLSTDGFRYILPSRYTPNANLRAIQVEKVSDENGPHHEVILLP